MIEIKSKKEIETMSQGGKILADIIKELKGLIKPGIPTQELNDQAENLIKKGGGKCSFKNYRGFPACLCTPINQEIVHVAPSDRKLRPGDIVSLDLGFFYNGFHTDMAITVPVGEIEPEPRRLIRITKQALTRAIKKVKPGNHLGDVSFVIQNYVEEKGFSVIKELCGHGIGREVHQEPQVLNYGEPGTGLKIKPGMAFCIEPMISRGGGKIAKSEDGYGFKTADNSLSAHFEHMVAVTKDGCQVLTKFNGI